MCHPVALIFLVNPNHVISSLPKILNDSESGQILYHVHVNNMD